MKMHVKQSLSIAAVAVLILSGSAKAVPLLDVTVEASTTQNGTYSATLASTPTNGTTLYYEVVAQFNVPASNKQGSITHSTDGATDAVVSLPDLILTAPSQTTFGSYSGGSGQFPNSGLQNNFNTGSSSLQGTQGSNTLTIKPVETGFTELADNALVLYTGAFTVGQTAFTGISIGAPGTVGSGSIKPSGSLDAITNTTETGADPIVSYSPLTVTPSPEPASLAMSFIGAGMLLVRRRRRSI